MIVELWIPSGTLGDGGTAAMIFETVFGPVHQLHVYSFLSGKASFLGSFLTFSLH